MLTSVVVNKRTGLPGAGFFSMGQGLGLVRDGESEESFARRELERTRDYWSSHSLT